MMNTQNPTNISDIIKNQRNKASIRQGYISLLQRILLLAMVGTLVLTQVFLITQASGMDMFPAIKDGDLMIGFRLQQNYQKNDLITYKVDGVRNVGRILGRENDVVTIDQDGTLRVNGTVQEGEIMYPTHPKEGIQYPYKVSEDSFFILGDYRTQAKDSRDYGSIPKGDVEGKVITILRRRGL